MTQRNTHPFRRAVTMWLVGWMASGIGTHPVLAATYYVNATTGNDARLPAQAQDPNSPWKSLTRAMAAALAPGDVLQVAAGTYDVGSGEKFPIPLQDGVAIMGAGADGTIVDGPSAGDIFLASGALSSGTWLGDLQIKTNSPGETSAQGLTIQTTESQTIRVDGVTFGPGLYRGIVQEYNSETPVHLDLHVSESMFDGVSDGIEIDNYGNSNSADLDLTVANNTFTDNQYATAVSMSSVSSSAQINVDVSGNTFTDSSDGVYFYLYYFQNGADVGMTVSNNTFTNVENPVEASFSYISQYGNATFDVTAAITDNHITGAYDGIEWTEYYVYGGTNTRNITISGNTIHDSDFSGIYVSAYSLRDNRYTRTATITGNTITNASGNGVFIGDYDVYDVDLSLKTTLQGNSITGGTYGVFASFSSQSTGNQKYDFRLLNNTINSTSNDGAYVYLHDMSELQTDVNVLMNGNTITDTGSSGLRVSLHSFSTANGKMNVELRDNVIANASGNGIETSIEELDNTNLDIRTLISGNTITGSDRHGIYASYSSQSSAFGNNSLEILENTISGSSESGVSVYAYSYSSVSMDSNFTIAGNTITDSGYHGIQLSMTSVSSGFDFQYKANVLNNRIENTGEDGIHVYTYGAYSPGQSSHQIMNVSGNWLKGSGTDGLYLFTGYWPEGEYDLTLGGNTISDSGDAGVELSLTSMYNQYRNSAMVMDNTVEKNASFGIYASIYDYAGGTFGVMSGNTVTENANTGIYLSMGSYNKNRPAFDLGGGPLSSAGLNTLIGNDTTGAGHQLSVNGEADGAMWANNNLWGSTDPSSIDAGVYDDEERCQEIPPVRAPTSGSEGARASSGGTQNDPTIAQVCGTKDSPYYVYLDNPQTVTPTTSARAALTTAVLKDTGLQGATPGDTLHVTAALTGTGQVGCAEATFKSLIPAGATLVADSVKTSKGAVLHGNSTDLKVALGWLAANETITVEWDLVASASESCTALNIQGTLTCKQLGDVNTDDPASPSNGDATAVSFTTNTFYQDSDNDGQGNPNQMRTSCLPGTPAGYVTNNTDCNDNDNTAYQGAHETCDGVDNSCDGRIDEGLTITVFPDADNDGQGDASNGGQEVCSQPEGTVRNHLDCNDQDDSIYVNANEVCDGLDNDCDGVTDDGVTLSFYADGDNDGYGAGDAVPGCSASAGLSANNEDCDDTTGSISPDAEEVCDGKDNNCDGRTDENGGNVYFIDSDGDGYGDANETTLGCDSAPEGYADNANDCDDDAAAINPDADEVCDGNDNNCDGLIDEDLTTLFFVDADKDGYGSSADYVAACTAPSGYVANNQDCVDSDNTINPDATEACDGIDNNCDGQADEGGDCIPGETPSPTPVIVIGGTGCSCDTRNSDAPAPVGGAATLLALAWLHLRRRRNPADE